MEKLDTETWANIFKNLSEMEEEDYYDGVETWVGAVYLDPMTENDSAWGLAYGDELFEEGFATEEESMDRLKCLEKELL